MELIRFGTRNCQHMLFPPAYTMSVPKVHNLNASAGRYIGCTADIDDYFEWADV